LSEPQVLTEGIAFGEQPRWHEGRLWFSDWGPPEVIAVDVAGNHEVMLPAPAFPCCVDSLQSDSDSCLRGCGARTSIWPTRKVRLTEEEAHDERDS